MAVKGEGDGEGEGWIAMAVPRALTMLGVIRVGHKAARGATATGPRTVPERVQLRAIAQGPGAHGTNVLRRSAGRP